MSANFNFSLHQVAILWPNLHCSHQWRISCRSLCSESSCYSRGTDISLTSAFCEVATMWSMRSCPEHYIAVVGAREGISKNLLAYLLDSGMTTLPAK